MNTPKTMEPMFLGMVILRAKSLHQLKPILLEKWLSPIELIEAAE